jgi:hypothetical protein
MEHADLPHSTPIGASDDPRHIAQLLRIVLGKEGAFQYSAVVEKSASSGRVISVAKNTGVTPLPGPMSAAQMAQHIGLLTADARYNPSCMDRAKKGWTVQKAEIGGKPAAIIWATWIL